MTTLMYTIFKDEVGYGVDISIDCIETKESWPPKPITMKRIILSGKIIHKSQEYILKIDSEINNFVEEANSRGRLNPRLLEERLERVPKVNL